jgi:hypothetical protein
MITAMARRAITDIRTIIIRAIMGMITMIGISSRRAGALRYGASRRHARSIALACAVIASLPPTAPALSQSSETMHVEDAYRECLFLKSRSGRYAHGDRESDFGLLGECRNQWVAYMDLCAKAGFDNKTCVMKSRLVIHAILDLNGK